MNNLLITVVLNQWESHIVGISKHWFVGDYNCDRFATIYPMIEKVIRARNGIREEDDVPKEAVYYVFMDIIKKFMQGKLLPQHILITAFKHLLFPNYIYDDKDTWKRFVHICMSEFSVIKCREGNRDLIEFDLKNPLFEITEKTKEWFK